MIYQKITVVFNSLLSQATSDITARLAFFDTENMLKMCSIIYLNLSKVFFYSQRGNPVLKFIKSVPWEYDDIIPDYEVGKTICLLFLSLRYHNMNPDYINNRIKELGKKYELRVLLIQV